MKIILLSIFFVITGIFLLNLAGGVFIEEITQEVSVADVAATEVFDGVEA